MIPACALVLRRVNLSDEIPSLAEEGVGELPLELVMGEEVEKDELGSATKLGLNVDVVKVELDSPNEMLLNDWMVVSVILKKVVKLD